MKPPQDDLVSRWLERVQSRPNKCARRSSAARGANLNASVVTGPASARARWYAGNGKGEAEVPPGTLTIDVEVERRGKAFRDKVLWDLGGAIVGTEVRAPEGNEGESCATWRRRSRARCAARRRSAPGLADPAPAP